MIHAYLFKLLVNIFTCSIELARNITSVRFAVEEIYTEALTLGLDDT